MNEPLPRKQAVLDACLHDMYVINRGRPDLVVCFEKDHLTGLRVEFGYRSPGTLPDVLEAFFRGMPHPERLALARRYVDQHVVVPKKATRVALDDFSAHLGVLEMMMCEPYVDFHAETDDEFQAELMDLWKNLREKLEN